MAYKPTCIWGSPSCSTNPYSHQPTEVLNPWSQVPKYQLSHRSEVLHIPPFFVSTHTQVCWKHRAKHPKTPKERIIMFPKLAIWISIQWATCSFSTTKPHVIVFVKYPRSKYQFWHSKANNMCLFLHSRSFFEVKPEIKSSRIVFPGSTPSPWDLKNDPKIFDGMVKLLALVYHTSYVIYGDFCKWGFPHSWMVCFMENPSINGLWLGVSLFQETHIYIYIYVYVYTHTSSGNQTWRLTLQSCVFPNKIWTYLSNLTVIFQCNVPVCQRVLSSLPLVNYCYIPIFKWIWWYISPISAGSCAHDSSFPAARSTARDTAPPPLQGLRCGPGEIHGKIHGPAVSKHVWSSNQTTPCKLILI